MNFKTSGFILTFANMIRSGILFLCIFSLAALVSCRSKRIEGSKPQLTVSIMPQQYLVSCIAGDKYDVQVMLPKGSNHETYEPAPRDMEKIATSKFYFTLGALDFELAWMDRFRASNREMMVINTSEGIEMISGHMHKHSEPEQEHGMHGTDPHTWLSPKCMKTQAANICRALASNDPENASYYNANLARFITTSDSVDVKIREILAGSQGKSILIFHPALGYFAREYKLTQISIEQDGKEPSPAYLGELIRTAKEQGIKSVFISKEFDTRNAEAIAREINGKVIVFDPMDENWPGNMVLLAKLIAEN